MKFKAKVDWWLHLIFSGLIIVNIWAGIDVIIGGSSGMILAVIFTPLSIFLIIPMWVNTYYLFENNMLIVKCGFIRYAKVDCELVTKVFETKNPISSPAPSLDRLEVCYKAKNDHFTRSVIISPMDKQGFIEQLKMRNENIETSVSNDPPSRINKILSNTVGIVSAIVVIGIGIMLIIGERETEVIIHNDSIQIIAMYGLTINFDEISDISFVEQSMRNIGAGIRTNGYAGGAWRGHFTAGLLFVRPDSAPTLRIERYYGSDILISFRDSERTGMLYRRLAWLHEMRLMR